MYRAPGREIDGTNMEAEALARRAEAALSEAGDDEAFVLSVDREPTPVCLALLARRPGRFRWAVLDVGPPAWRVEIGRRADDAPPETIAEALAHDHGRLTALLARFAESVGTRDSAAIGRAFARFDRGLARHVHVEEDLLFRPFDYHARLRYGPLTTVLADQHRVCARLVDQTRRLVAGLHNGHADPAPILDRIGPLRLTLAAHHEKEETSLLPACDELLPAERIFQILSAMKLWTPERGA
jgi:uncharacterized protein (DUF2249 family)